MYGENILSADSGSKDASSLDQPVSYPAGSGVSVVAALQAELDMALLEKCLREEICRYGCMRVRFTRPDKHGEVQQYIMKRDNRKLKTFDLSDLSMEKADEIMQGWAYETFEGDDVPMCEIRLMKLPEGYEASLSIWITA